MKIYFSVSSFGFFCVQNNTVLRCSTWFYLGHKRKNKEENIKNSYFYLQDLLFLNYGKDSISHLLSFIPPRRASTSENMSCSFQAGGNLLATGFS